MCATGPPNEVNPSLRNTHSTLAQEPFVDGICLLLYFKFLIGIGVGSRASDDIKSKAHRLVASVARASERIECSHKLPTVLS